jgi:hypothetical protein
MDARHLVDMPTVYMTNFHPPLETATVFISAAGLGRMTNTDGRTIGRRMAAGILKADAFLEKRPLFALQRVPELMAVVKPDRLTSNRSATPTA